MIWTTTPWTIPVNQAIAYGPEIEYIVSRVDGVIDEMSSVDLAATSDRSAELARRRFDCKRVCTSGLHDRRRSTLDMTLVSRAPTSPAPSPATRCTISAASSPSRARSCPATSSPPTPAPASSTWRPTMARTISTCARRNGIDPVFAVEGDGKYREDWGWLGGQGSVINAKFNAPDGPICTDLREAGGAARGVGRLQAQLSAQLAVEGQGHLPLHPAMVHRRWTGRCPTIIARASPSSAGTMKAARSARDRRCARSRCRPSPTPASSPKRAATASHAMVEGRPDWVISRQRAWGVPIALFVDRKTGAAAGRPGGQRAHRRRDQGGRRRCLGRRARAGLSRQRL